MNEMQNAAQQFINNDYSIDSYNDFMVTLLKQGHRLDGESADIYDGMYFQQGKAAYNSTKKIAQLLVNA